MTRSARGRLLIARPRGFCAGVERAIAVVDFLLHATNETVFVRKEIVHNRAVVEDFRRRGVVFVEELSEVPDGGLVVFSAHGISPAVRLDAERRGLRTIDATCPLVTKVHREVVRHAASDRHIVLIGHAGHDEVLGTMGEAPGSITLVTSAEDVQDLTIPAGIEIAYVTQTTLSVDETEEIVTALRGRFPDLVAPPKSDICYATQNRQDAVKELLAQGVQYLIVVGSQNSSNSVRLCEVAEKMGARSCLVNGPEELPLSELQDLACLGLTAGASAPEHLVQAVADRLQELGWIPEEYCALVENVKFQLPKELSAYTDG